MKKKTFKAPIVLNKADGEEGTFTSVFAKFSVIDHDGDITEPGAFAEGQDVVVEGWNHDYGLPVGKGTIRQDEVEARIDGRFFLDTQAGLDHYKTLKNLGGIEEWSYTFTIEEGGREKRDGEDVYILRKLDVWGVAPVTRGAGIDTRTLALKRAQETPDGEESDEGQGNEDIAVPSGAPPSVVLSQIQILELEV